MVLSQRTLTSSLPVSTSKAEAPPAPTIMATATASGRIRFPTWVVCLLLVIPCFPFPFLMIWFRATDPGRRIGENRIIRIAPSPSPPLGGGVGGNGEYDFGDKPFP